MIYLIVFVVVVLAVARMTRLTTTDKITQGVRDAVERRYGHDSFIAELLDCDWCTAVWWSSAANLPPLAVAVATETVPWWLALSAYPYLVAAVSYSAAHLTTRGD